jgi:hypothetical protein
MIYKEKKMKIFGELRSDLFIGLCAVFSTVWLCFLYCQLKNCLSKIKSLPSILAQWKNQNNIHFKLLYILSGVMCLGWITFGLVAEVKQSIGSFHTFFNLLLLSLACLICLWITYFAIYGFIKICTHKPIICLWIGIVSIVSIGIFPPFYYQRPVLIDTNQYDRSAEQPKSSEELNTTDTIPIEQKYYFRLFGYHCIFLPYDKREAFILKPQIYTSLLIIQWIIASVVTSGLFLTFKKNK